jgi:hypothetical protein
MAKITIEDPLTEEAVRCDQHDCPLLRFCNMVRELDDRYEEIFNTYHDLPIIIDDASQLRENGKLIMETIGAACMNNYCWDSDNASCVAVIRIEDIES